MTEPITEEKAREILDSFHSKLRNYGADIEEAKGFLSGRESMRAEMQTLVEAVREWAEIAAVKAHHHITEIKLLEALSTLDHPKKHGEGL